MAEEVEMTPVSAAEPPKANPLETPKAATLKLAPQIRKPGTPTAALKPGLKLPPKPGLAAGLKLPTKPGTPTAALKPGLKLPTQAALKPGIKLPPKPVIRKPGATVAAVPLPKPLPKPVETAKPAEAAKPVEVAKPAEVEKSATPAPKPMEALKSVTQKLKGITQEIPQQAILRKTGIIADGSVNDVQKEAAKHKTARISLSDAMGVAPVKDEHAPMKTIRIKRPVDISGATKPTVGAPAPTPAADAPAAEAPAPTPTATATPTITQRKTLKISRPGGMVRPSGKFGVKRPSQATTVAAQPAAAGVAGPASAEGAVADIADIPDMPAMAPVAAAPANDGPAWLWSLSTLVQAAACVAIGALAWFLYQNTQTAYF